MTNMRVSRTFLNIFYLFAASLIWFANLFHNLGADALNDFSPNTDARLLSSVKNERRTQMAGLSVDELAPSRSSLTINDRYTFRQEQTTHLCYLVEYIFHGR